MAGRGPVPKDPSKRVRRNKETRTAVATADEVLGPPLPTHFGPQGGRIRFAPSVRKRWEMWRRSPQAQTFESTDWQRLMDLAPLWHELDTCTRAGDRLKLMAELRLQEERFGATVADRQRLKLDVKRPKQEQPAAPASDSVSARRASMRVV